MTLSRISLKVGDVLVESSSEHATEDAAAAVANVLSETWLEGTPLSAPIDVTLNYEDSGPVVYRARRLQ